MKEEIAYRRRQILEILNDDPGYRKNVHLIHRILGLRGVWCSLDALVADLYWLREVGLVALEENLGVLVARLTPRGQDVAEGRTHVPGVAKPQPEE